MNRPGEGDVVLEERRHVLRLERLVHLGEMRLDRLARLLVEMPGRLCRGEPFQADTAGVDLVEVGRLIGVTLTPLRAAAEHEAVGFEHPEDFADRRTAHPEGGADLFLVDGEPGAIPGIRSVGQDPRDLSGDHRRRVRSRRRATTSPQRAPSPFSADHIATIGDHGLAGHVGGGIGGEEHRHLRDFFGRPPTAKRNARQAPVSR